MRARDGHRCTKCCITNEEHIEKYGRQLEVHRLNPRSRYTLDGCITVCASCHKPEAKRYPPKGERPTTSFRISSECRDTIRRRSDEIKLSDAAIIELAIRKLDTEGIPGILRGTDPLWAARAEEELRRQIELAASRPGRKRQ